MNFVRLSAETARLAPFSLSPRQRAACTCLYTSVTAQSAAMLGATGAKRSYPQFNPAAEPTGATSEINAAVTRSAHANRARGAVGLSSSNRSRVSNCAVAAANPSALKVHQVQVAAAQSDKASMLCQLEAASSWPCAVAEPFAAAAAAAVERLKAAILKAEVKDIELGCQLLILPNGEDGEAVSWPGLESNVLFVRRELKRMFEEKLGSFLPSTAPHGSTSRCRHTLLRGVPGIGTSSFGLYALWRLVTSRRSVLYQYAKGLPKGTALSFRFGTDPCKPEVNIADGCTPDWPVSAAGPARLVIASPEAPGYGALADKELRPFYHSFAKDAASLYMREPRADELLAMGKHCFGLRDDDVAGQAAARDRMRRHGHNPRLVFGRTDLAATMLEQAIKAQRIAALRSFAQTPSDALLNWCGPRGIGFNVIHYDVSDDCRSVAYRWASPYVAERVAEVLQEADVSERRLLVDALLRQEELRSMAGPLLEKWRDI